jgi:hypothetical protein
MVQGNRLRTVLAIYGPMIYTALYVMLLMRANLLHGQVGGGWALEIRTFLGPVKWHRAVRRVPFGAVPYQSEVHRQLTSLCTRASRGPSAVNFYYRTAPPSTSLHRHVQWTVQ